MNAPKKYFVYLIGECIDTGYIGVTCNKLQRWKAHLRSTYPVGEYIRNNNLEFSDDTMKTLYEGTSQDCFHVEVSLRPTDYMGLNVASGGQGGYTTYSPERNRKISQALKGQKVTWGDKVSQTKKQLGIAIGDKNPKAKKWKFTAPSGEQHIVVGSKQQFCDNHSLLASCLVYHLGTFVPPISKTSGRGGFRSKNKNSLHRRLNSVGWMLETIN
jgi:hypothetical protein